MMMTILTNGTTALRFAKPGSSRMRWMSHMNCVTNSPASRGGRVLVLAADRAAIMAENLRKRGFRIETKVVVEVVG